MVKENTLDYTSMEIEEGSSHWWKENTSSKDTTRRRWCSKVCSIICITLTLFLILVVVVFLKFNQQGNMLRELETKADNLASSLHSLPSKLQQTAPDSNEVHYKELKEIQSALTNLGASITSLSSELQGTAEKEGSRLAVLEHSVTNLTHSVNALSTGLQDTADQQDTKMQQLENAVNSKMEQAVSQQDLRLQGLEIAVKNMSSSLDTIPAKLQHTDEQLITMLNNLTAEIKNTQRRKGNPQYHCQNSVWRLHASSCYLFSLNKLPWHTARDYCKTQGGSLLVLNDADEWQFIFKQLPQHYWIGLTDETTGIWRWVDGTPYIMDKTQWNDGQPDDWRGHGLEGGEDCGMMLTKRKLNDAHCTEEYAYICERAAIAD